MKERETPIPDGELDAFMGLILTDAGLQGPKRPGSGPGAGDREKVSPKKKKKSFTPEILDCAKRANRWVEKEKKNSLE